MWKVEGPGGSSAYLLGSLHVLTADFYPLNATINKAFAESKTLVEEIDIDETSDPMVMMAALSKAMLTDGRTLDQIIAPDVYAEVKKRAEKAGMPMMAIQRMKPWLVAITLMAPTLQAAGFKPELGIDRHFFDRAKDSGHEAPGARDDGVINSISSIQLSPKLQEELLKTTMEDLDKEVNGVKDMAQAWQFGNVAAMEKMTLVRAEGSAGAVSDSCSSSAITTGSRTSKRASNRTPAASSSSAPRISLARTACRPCSRRRATGSPSNKVSGCPERTQRFADVNGASTAQLEIRPESTRFVASGLICSRP